MNFLKNLLVFRSADIGTGGQLPLTPELKNPNGDGNIVMTQEQFNLLMSQFRPQAPQAPQPPKGVSPEEIAKLQAEEDAKRALEAVQKELENDANGHLINVKSWIESKKDIYPQLANSIDTIIANQGTNQAKAKDVMIAILRSKMDVKLSTEERAKKIENYTKMDYNSLKTLFEEKKSELMQDNKTIALEDPEKEKNVNLYKTNKSKFFENLHKKASEIEFKSGFKSYFVA